MHHKLKTIMIGGYYGVGNTGDEAILEVILSKLKKDLPTTTFIVVSGNPEQTQMYHKVRSILWSDIDSIKNAAQESDLFILGGGGIFHDYQMFDPKNLLTKYHTGIALYMILPLLSILLNKPLIIYAVGIGPLFSKEAKELTRVAFEQAWVSTVRDSESKDQIIALGIKEERIHVTADPAIDFDGITKENVISLLKSEGVTFDQKPLVGVALRDWDINMDSGKWQKEVAYALDEMIEKYHANVIFLPFQRTKGHLVDDYFIAKKIKDMMYHKESSVVLERNYDAREIAGILGRCDLVLGMRYHSILFAAKYGVPFVGLVYDQKVRNLMTMLDCEDYAIDLLSLKGNILLSQMANIMKNHKDIRDKLNKKVSELTKLVEDKHLLVMTLINKIDSMKNDITEPTGLLKKILLNMMSFVELKEQDLSAKNSAIYHLEQDLSAKNSAIDHLEQDLSADVKQIEELEKELSFQRERITQIYNSKSWKMGQLYAKKFGGTPVGKLGEKIVNHLIKTRDYGVDKNASDELQLTVNQEHIIKQSDQIPQITILTKAAYDKVLDARKQYGKIYKIIASFAESKGIIIYPPTVDWNIPLLQRPQHLAQYMASKGWLYFYCTSNTYDKISGFQKLQHGLYLTDRYTDLVNNLDGFVFVVHSGHPTLTIEDIEKLKGKALIVYDYLDEIHPSVSGLQLQNVYARHKYLIENSDIVLVTADKLLLEVKQLRNKDVYLLSNAVDYEHFHVQKNITTIPGEIKKILGNTKKPIVGYFGALASWVDYDLIRYIATKRSDLEFVLIGWDYDGSLEKSKLLGIKNVHYLGVKEYEKLPNYAIWFDICILPFSLNEVTHATSPIKLFEYMALGKPIISTPIKEALKYKSVIIANDKKQFAEKIDDALKLRDDDHYLELVDNEARENTWEIRFTQLDKILQDVLHEKHFYQKNKWFREIIKVQNEISRSLTESSFYVDTYKNEEVNYWSHIPTWILQDNRDDKILRCLDVGCGYGTIALFCKKLLNCEIYCIDTNDYLRQSLIETYDFKFKVNNIELDPFPWNDIKFDIIIFTEVLEHFNFHPLPTLQKIHDLLSENGRVYLSTPDALEWGKAEHYDSLDDIPCPNKETKIIDGHIYQYNEKELTDIIDKAGFKILRIDYSKGVIYRHFNLTLAKK
ncbi:MAG TPA: polysaccharide pyruvyl transferase family protein [Verrucomicrobiae bacterium]|nr:polysaccharide pyruvyl transferase family protein [Verrucomicrobiae bacterium]